MQLCQWQLHSDHRLGGSRRPNLKVEIRLDENFRSFSMQQTSHFDPSFDSPCLCEQITKSQVFCVHVQTTLIYSHKAHLLKNETEIA